MKYLDTSAFVKYYGSPDLEKGVDFITQLIEKALNGGEILVTEYRA